MLEKLVEEAPGIGGNIILVLLFLRFIKVLMNGWRDVLKDNTSAIQDLKEHLSSGERR